MPNPARMADVYPLFLKHIVPVFVGKDARELESLLWDVYRHDEQLQVAGPRPVGRAWRRSRWRCSSCWARPPSGRWRTSSAARCGATSPSTSPAATAATRPRRRSSTCRSSSPTPAAKALKFRLGGRMSRNADSLPGRTEALIPLVRKTFGDGLHPLRRREQLLRRAARPSASAGSWRSTATASTRSRASSTTCGATKEVADALTIPVAGGEQEFSLHRWQWAIANRGAGHRAARPALRRRLHPRDAGRAHGGGGGHDGGAAHVRRRARATSTWSTSRRSRRTSARSWSSRPLCRCVPRSRFPTRCGPRPHRLALGPRPSHGSAWCADHGRGRWSTSTVGMPSAISSVTRSTRSPRPMRLGIRLERRLSSCMTLMIRRMPLSKATRS